MMKNKWMCLCMVALIISGCKSNGKQESAMPIADGVDTVSTLNTALQCAVDSMLKKKMVEIGALQGQAIVMEVKTGHIVAMAGLERDTNNSYTKSNHFALQQEPGSTANLPMLMAACETGYMHMDDDVDVKEGVWLLDGRIIKDHNWRKGGYGRMITYEEAVVFSSNVAVAKGVWATFKDDEQELFKRLDAMSYGKPDSIGGIPGLKPMAYSSPSDSNWIKSRIIYHAIGYERLIAPIQTLTFYNAIANNGRMVMPTLLNRPAEVINWQIASLELIRDVQHTLVEVTSEVGLGKRAKTDKTAVAINVGTAHLHDEEYHMNVCGYFPAENPQYSLIISVNKENLPVSAGGMLGPVFKEIVEWMVCNL